MCDGGDAPLTMETKARERERKTERAGGAQRQTEMYERVRACGVGVKFLNLVYSFPTNVFSRP